MDSFNEWILRDFLVENVNTLLIQGPGFSAVN